MRRALALLALVALALPAGAAAEIVRKTWHVRWPASGKSKTYILEMRVPKGNLGDVTMRVDGAEFVPDGYVNTIVACAHRNPSFAGAQFSVPRFYVARFRLTLESGLCLGGPKTAGKLATVTAAVEFLP